MTKSLGIIIFLKIISLTLRVFLASALKEGAKNTPRGEGGTPFLLGELTDFEKSGWGTTHIVQEWG